MKQKGFGKQSLKKNKKTFRIWLITRLTSKYLSTKAMITPLEPVFGVQRLWDTFVGNRSLPSQEHPQMATVVGKGGAAAIRHHWLGIWRVGPCGSVGP